MSIENNQPTEETVETTDANNGELSKDEADATAGGIQKKFEHGGWEPHRGELGDSAPPIRYQ
jgi:hypothetical protein